MTRKHPDNNLLGPRDAFITENMPLVLSISKRHYRRAAALKIPREDVVSEGYIGLILAYDNYSNAAYGFSTYASAYINGQIMKFFRAGSENDIRLPLATYHRVIQIKRRCLENEPPEVIAKELGIRVEYAEDAIIALRARDISRFETQRDADKQYKYSHNVDYTNDDVETFLALLPERSRKIVRLLMAGHSLTEAGKAVGISRQMVGKLLIGIRELYLSEQRAIMAA